MVRKWFAECAHTQGGMQMVVEITFFGLFQFLCQKQTNNEKSRKKEEKNIVDIIR